jgi:hypothetical protein
VRTAWREFMSASNVAVQQALAAQQANRLAANRAPPLWAIAAIIFLGWNELMAVLWNPLLLLLGLAAFLFSRTMYTELEVDAELQKGALPGALALSAKFMPTLQRVGSRTMESARQLLLVDGQQGSHSQGHRREQAQRQEVEVSAGSAASAAGSPRASAQPHPSGQGLSRRRVEAAGN